MRRQVRLAGAAGKTAIGIGGPWLAGPGEAVGGGPWLAGPGEAVGGGPWLAGPGEAVGGGPWLAGPGEAVRGSSWVASRREWWLRRGLPGEGLHPCGPQIQPGRSAGRQASVRPRAGTRLGDRHDDGAWHQHDRRDAAVRRWAQRDLGTMAGSELAPD